MNYISLKELADKWDISIKYLQTLARTGMLEGAIKKDHRWFVPEDIRHPGRPPRANRRLQGLAQAL